MTALGSLVFFSVRVGDGLLAPDVKDVLEAAGIRGDLVPPAPIHAHAARRAIADAARSAGQVAKHVADSPGAAVWNITPFGMRVAFLKTEGRFVFDSERVVSEEARAVVGRLECDATTYYDRYIGRLDRDALREMVRRYLVRWDGVRMTAGMGVYFVPAAWTKEVRLLQTAVRSLGKSEMGIIEVADTLETREAVATGVAQSFEEEIAALEDDLAKRTTCRPSTLERRLAQVRSIRQHVRDMAKRLGSPEMTRWGDDGLLDRLASAQVTIEGRMGVKAARAAAGWEPLPETAPVPTPVPAEPPPIVPDTDARAAKRKEAARKAQATRRARLEAEAAALETAAAPADSFVEPEADDGDAALSIAVEVSPEELVAMAPPSPPPRPAKPAQAGRKAPPAPPLFSARPIAELQRLCIENGISTKGLKKDDMVAALEAVFSVAS